MPLFIKEYLIQSTDVGVLHAYSRVFLHIKLALLKMFYTNDCMPVGRSSRIWNCHCFRYKLWCLLRESLGTYQCRNSYSNHSWVFHLSLEPWHEFQTVVQISYYCKGIQKSGTISGRKDLRGQTSFWSTLIGLVLPLLNFKLSGEAWRFPIISFCCRSVTQSCLTLCDHMDCSTPDLPVFHHLPELVQI